MSGDKRENKAAEPMRVGYTLHMQDGAMVLRYLRIPESVAARYAVTEFPPEVRAVQMARMWCDLDDKTVTDFA